MEKINFSVLNRFWLGSMFISMLRLRSRLRWGGNVIIRWKGREGKAMKGEGIQGW